MTFNSLSMVSPSQRLIKPNLFYKLSIAGVVFVEQIFFKQRILDEDGYILSVKKNGLQILIPKYGLEGIIYLNKNVSVFNEEVRPVTAVVFI